MAKSYSKVKGRAGNGAFLALPHALLNTGKALNLSGWSHKLINDLGVQYNGFNNGDLCATWSMMKKRGWRSPSTLHASVKELLLAGFIVVTRQGGRNRPTLYALTWQPVDECKGKLDAGMKKIEAGKWRD